MNTEPQWTKGPWAYVENPDGLYGVNVISIYADSGGYLAEVYRGFIGSENVSKEEHAANANLIAQAPRMYAEIEKMVDLAQSLGVDHYPEIEEALEVMAAARGE